MASSNIHEFIHETRYADLPDHALHGAKRSLLDLIGVMAAGSRTQLASIICDHAADHFGVGNKEATIMLDGRSVSPAGAALANGMMIDSIDAHDGYKETKGHIGCHVLPSLLALFEAEKLNSGGEFMTSFVVGYEIGARAGVALHTSVPDYHTSGAWGAVTAAALGARLTKLDASATRHAMGIGEYHGPRSQMMRCIDYPTMLKDGSGWGAMAGVSATYLAQSGFTGAPALTIESDEVSHLWEDLGSNWTTKDQYFKPYPVCRWAQPATEAALTLKREQGFEHDDIDQITVHTFHEASRLATSNPETTEEAQYSLPFPVAAALVFGQVGPDEVDGASLNDPRVLRLSDGMILKEHEPYNEVFPAQRYAHVEVRLKDGTVHVSDRHPARGDPEDPLSDKELEDKFYFLANPVIGETRAKKIHDLVIGLGESRDVNELLATLRPPTHELEAVQAKLARV